GTHHLSLRWADACSVCPGLRVHGTFHQFRDLTSGRRRHHLRPPYCEPLPTARFAAGAGCRPFVGQTGMPGVQLVARLQEGRHHGVGSGLSELLLVLFCVVTPASPPASRSSSSFCFASSPLRPHRPTTILTLRDRALSRLHR